jgi:NAD-dependent SIR2 family protein deacetylase
LTEYKKRIKQAIAAIQAAEYILVGAGAGLSDAAGLTYSGKRFFDNFADFHTKYGFTDMYSASFYPFETPEELWAHWARHISVNRYEAPPAKLYIQLLEIVKAKDFFVITTNVESQFEKAGFLKDKIFEVQGNYAYLQCAKSCHDKLYYNESIVSEMLKNTVDCRIPSNLIPQCPICGGCMDVNLRHNDAFVEDKIWLEAQERYSDFLQTISGKRIVLLELGVGFNTPGIVRYPFEQLTYQNPDATLIRFNRDYPLGASDNKAKTISFDEDISKVIVELLHGLVVRCANCSPVQPGRHRNERDNQLYA